MPRVELDDEEMKLIREFRLKRQIMAEGWNSAIEAVVEVCETDSAEITFNELVNKIKELRK